MITFIAIQVLNFAAFVLLVALVFLNRPFFSFKRRVHLHQLPSESDQRMAEIEISAREHALRQISMEIHDNIAHTLALCRIQLNALITTKDGTCNDGLNHAGLLLSNALNSVSNLSHQLSGQSIEHDSLPEAINKTVDFFAHIKNMKVTLEILGDPFPLGGTKELHIYRIVQEALHNVLKHARAGSTNIVLHYCEQRFECTIKDDGIGFDERNTLKCEGAGLCNMKKRALLASASLVISSIPGNGTLIRIYLPLLNRN